MGEYGMKQKRDKQEIQERIILLGLLFILVGLLVLIFWMGKYSFRQVDDFAYAHVESVWLETHSVLKTMVGELSQTIENWKTWQGLYFGDWIYFVLLAIFGREGYFVSSYLTVMCLVCAELYAGKTILCDIMEGTRTESYIVTIPLILLQLMFLPSAAEGIYWMCAAVHYTMALGIEIFTVALLFRLLFLKTDSARLWMKIGIVFLLFALAGCNFVTSLNMVCIYGLLIIYAWIKKKKERLFLTIGYLWFLIWFMISVISPGNMNRQLSSGEGLGALQAILRSFVEAGKYLTDWWILPVTLIMLAVMPMLRRIALRKTRSFRMPLLFSALSFCVYASQFTPNLYALGQIGAYRVQNIYRLTLYILLFANEGYWIGYLVRFQKDKAKNRSAVPFGNVLFAIIAVLVIAPIMLFHYGDTVTAVSAYKSLRSGQAKRYYQENQERIALMESDEQDIVLEPFSAPPYLLHFGDLQVDAASWENVAYAQYFGKNTVRIQE